MINAILNKVLPEVFDKELADAVHQFTGKRVNDESIFDPVKDEYVMGSDLLYSGRGTVRDYNDFEIQATQIDITDLRLSVLQTEITEEPRIDDIIHIQGQDRRVMRVSPSSTNLKWVLQLRGLRVG